MRDVYGREPGRATQSVPSSAVPSVPASDRIESYFYGINKSLLYPNAEVKAPKISEFSLVSQIKNSESLVMLANLSLKGNYSICSSVILSELL